MTHKIYRSVNYYMIEIDDRKQLAPLADYITDATNRVRPIEIRYHYAANTGVIVCDYNDDVTDEQVNQIVCDYEQRQDKNTPAGEAAERSTRPGDSASPDD